MQGVSDKAILEHERQQYEVFNAVDEQWKARLLDVPKKDRDAFIAESSTPKSENLVQ